MALMAFGTHEARRAQVATMRLVATAMDTRPFDGGTADLVRMFAGLMGCAGCHGFEESLDFSDLTGDTVPWSNSDEAIAMIGELIADFNDRIEAANSGLLVALFADTPDLEGLLAARDIARGLGCDDSLIDGVVAAKGDQFFLEMLAKTGHRTAKPAGFEAAQ